MSALDQVLAALDAGLQTSTEQGYPPAIDHPELRARCLSAHHVKDGDLCQPCKDWMLGDSDDDPCRQPLTIYEDGSVRGYLAVQYPGFPLRVDFETHPSPGVMSAYGIHHLDGDSRNNDPSNLEIARGLSGGVLLLSSRVAGGDVRAVRRGLCVRPATDHGGPRHHASRRPRPRRDVRARCQ